MIRQITRYGIAILVLAFLVELALLSYTALAAVVIGSVVSWPLVHLARFIVANWKRIWLPVIITLSLVGCALYMVVLLPLFLTPDPPPPLIQQYHMTVAQANWRTGDFTIKETVGNQSRVGFVPPCGRSASQHRPSRTERDKHSDRPTRQGSKNYAGPSWPVRRGCDHAS